MAIVEIRGRGAKWTVWYENETAVAHPVDVYDKNGEHVGQVLCAGPSDQPFVESNFSGTFEECQAYAEWLHPGCEIRTNRKKTRSEALKKANRARRRDRLPEPA